MTSLPDDYVTAVGISTHTLTWSVTAVVDFQPCQGHFNSHAHVERDLALPYYPPQDRISTHTLTWSVTRYLGHDRGQQSISTHTLTWSVTLDVVYIWCLLNVMRTYFFYLMGIGLILFTVHSQIAWHFHANLLGICESLGVRWSKY